MKQNICGAIVGLCLMFIIGVIGGIDFQGEPLKNVWMTIPAIAIMLLAFKVGNLSEYEEE